MEQEASQLTTLSKSNEAVTGHKTVSFIGESVSKHTMTISGDVLQMIIQQLTDLYSDPISASIRETVSNAIDATILARNEGVDAPNVDIHPPSSFSPTFIVEDHGVGMTRSQIYANFADYGNSTKINDMGATGSKGLGAKAPLAYTTTCVVSTVRDGRKIVLTLNRGEHVNEAETIFDGSTDEPNGTRVEIPVRPEDVEKFNTVISQYARYATPDIPLSIDGKPASADFDKAWTHLIDIPVAMDSDGKPINGKLYVNRGNVYGGSENIGSAFSSWLSASINTNWYWSDGSFAERYVSISLMGWKYNLNSVGSTRFLLEIQPGVVDFPPSRDEIKRNDRFKSLIAAVNSGLDLPLNSNKSHPLDGRSISRIWGNVPVSDRSIIIENIVDLDDEKVASSILDRLREIWPDEVAVHDHDKIVESFDTVLNLTVTPYYLSEKRPSIASTIGYGVPLAHNEKSDDDHNYVKYEFADGSISSLNSVLNDDMDYEARLRAKALTFNLSKVSSVVRKEGGSYLTSGVLKVPIDWMKSAFHHIPRNYRAKAVKALVVTGGFDGSKSFGRLRNWIRENYDDNDNACQIYCCIANGSYPDGHFDGFRDAAIDAGVKWMGVVDADDLIVKKSVVKKTTPAVVKTRVPALVEGNGGLGVEERAMNLLRRNDLKAVEEVTFKDLVRGGSIVFFSYSNSFNSMIGIFRRMVENPDVFNGHDIVVISDIAKIKAADLEPLTGYDKIFISDSVTGRIRRFKSMKTAQSVPYAESSAKFRDDVICGHPDAWRDTIVDVLSDPRIFSYGSSLGVIDEVISIEDDRDYEDKSDDYASLMRKIFNIASAPDDILGIADMIWKNTEDKLIRGAVRTALYHWELTKIIDDIDRANPDLVFFLRIFSHSWLDDSPRIAVKKGGESSILTAALSWFKQYEDKAWDEVDKLGYKAE
jgi:hypothetical protein